jgi:hypothetical protein
MHYFRRIFLVQMSENLLFHAHIPGSWFRGAVSKFQLFNKNINETKLSLKKTKMVMSLKN